MNNNFADYETSKMLKDLKFDEDCLGLFDSNKKVHFDRSKNKNSHYNSVVSPLWQQIKQWLYKSENIHFEFRFSHRVHAFIASAWKDGFNISEIESNDPIIAETSCISSTIKHLYEKTL